MKRHLPLDPALARPLAMLAIAVAITTALLLAAIQHSTSARNAWLDAQSLLVARQRQFADAHLEKSAIEENLRAVRQWQRQGLIGGENRLAWSEAMQDAARTLGIPDVRFKFAPRKAVGKSTHAGMRWHASTLQLSATGIDEVRLLGLLKEIETGPGAESIIRRCDLKRATSRADEPPSVEAECLIDWLTIGQDTEAP